MAKTKTKKYESTADGPVTVYVPGHSSIQFVPGDTRTVETDDAVVQAALDANPDVKEVKR